MGQVRPGDAVQAFVRPEAVRLARDDASLGSTGQPAYRARVESLLFDGANSAVLVREDSSRTEFRIALPQTGQLADLAVGEAVCFTFDPQRAVCFGATHGG